MEQNHIMFINVNGKGDDVLVFTTLSEEILRKAFQGRITWDDCFTVPPQDVQFYIYEPCHLTPCEEQQAEQLAQAV